MIVLRWKDVHVMVKLSRSTVYRLEKRGDFPARIQLSPNGVGWKKNEVDKWIMGRSSVPA